MELTVWEKQFQEERLANFFCQENSRLHFLPELQAAMLDNAQTPMSGAKLRQTVLFCAHRFLQQQFEANQYLEFSASSRKKLRQIYWQLLTTLPTSSNLSLLNEIERSHYDRLRAFLDASNPFYRQHCEAIGTPQLSAVVCREYSAEFQIQLFHIIDCAKWELSPLLDIGCGEHAFLVRYLRKCGTAAYGFDRLQENRSYLRKSDWFEFHYGKKRWQTILSNLSFSSHFRAALSRKDGTDKNFWQTYRIILESLRTGGRWLYAPSLPEVEVCLSSHEFRVTVRPIDAENAMTTIERLKA